jgi:hypothetical protein
LFYLSKKGSGMFSHEFVKAEDGGYLFTKDEAIKKLMKKSIAG